MLTTSNVTYRLPSRHQTLPGDGLDYRGPAMHDMLILLPDHQYDQLTN
jgi:hypothetical protein